MTAARHAASAGGTASEFLGQLTPVLLDPMADTRWGEFVASAPEASVFHHPAWLRILHEQYGYAMAVCGVAGADGRLVAGLPVAKVASRLTGRRLVALPFSDHCAPLVAVGAPAPASAVLRAALDTLRRRHGLRLEVRASGAALVDAPAGPRFHHHVLRLGPDPAAVERGFRKAQVLRGVRRAVRAGLHAERRTDVGSLEEFYRLHAATRARLGVPTHPRRFILRFAEIFREGLGFVVCVRRGEQPVAAAVFLTFRGVLTYKYGASDARALTARPNNLLLMEAIRWGCCNGMHALDFGRTDWGHESLRAFKLAWGSEERELRYRLLGATDRGEVGTVEFALAAVLRRSPPVVSRIVGELLYRHVG